MSFTKYSLILIGILSLVGCNEEPTTGGGNPAAGNLVDGLNFTNGDFAAPTPTPLPEPTPEPTPTPTPAP